MIYYIIEGVDFLESREKALKIAEILDSKKAKEIQVLKLADLTTVTDYFVICTGNSVTQVKALADEVEEKLAEMGETPLSIEGYRSAGWVLIDLGDVVVHIFTKEMREFYGLERLWSDAEKEDIEFEE